MAEPPPVPPPVTPTPKARFEPHKLAAQFVRPQLPPEAHLDRVVYGMMQPVLGARTLVGDRELLRGAMLPAGLLALFCALSAFLRADGWDLRQMARYFYQSLFALAPLPSLFLARYYARLAAAARHKLGFPASEPCIEPLWYAAKRWLKQLILVAAALVPLSIVLHLLPFIGPLVLQLVAAVWALHWIVVDAFDSARTLKPGQTLAELDAEAEHAAVPWFVRAMLHAAERLGPFGGVLDWFARRCDRLATPWREEMALVVDHPSLAIGFALTTALLVATPVLNLLFRPIVIIGAAHVLGRLEQLAAAGTPSAA